MRKERKIHGAHTLTISSRAGVFKKQNMPVRVPRGKGCKRSVIQQEIRWLHNKGYAHNRAVAAAIHIANQKCMTKRMG